MECALYIPPAQWDLYLPPDVRPVRCAAELTGCRWDLLALTPEGCRCLDGLDGQKLRCGMLLVPGTGMPRGIQAETVVTYGLSHRDSLTLSSLSEPVLCVQRALPRLEGGSVEPQEIPLPPLPGEAEILLPLLGMRLLRMPLTALAAPW